MTAERLTGGRASLKPEATSIPLPIIETDEMIVFENEAESAVLSDSPVLETDLASDSELEQLMPDEVLEVQTEIAGEPFELLDFPELPEPASGALWEKSWDDAMTSEIQTIQVEERLAEYLEPLEPEEVEAVVALAAAVVQTARQLIELSVSEVTDTETIEEVRRELKELFIELLTSLGVEYDEESIERFLQSLMRQEEAADDRSETADRPMEEGTHEQKSGSFDLLNDLSLLIKQKLPSLYMLGRLALRSEPPIILDLAAA